MEEAPDTYKLSIIQAIVSGGDLVNALGAANSASFSSNTDAYFRYGRDYYTYGTPTSSASYGEINSANVLEVLKGIAKQEVFVDREEIGLADSGVGYAYRVEYWHLSDINISTSDLAVATELVATVTNAVEVLRTSLLATVFTTDTITTLALYESLLLAAEVTGTISADDHTVIYNAIEASPVIVDQPTTDAASIAGHTSAGTYNNIDNVTAQRIVVSDTEVPLREFYYEIADGTYPILSNTLDLSDRYLPVVPVKEDKVYASTSSAKYKTGEELLRKLGLNTQAFKDAVEGSGIAPENVEDFFFAFTADMKSKDPATLRYLFALWEREAIANSINPKVTAEILPDERKGGSIRVPSAGWLPQYVYVPAGLPTYVGLDITESNYDSHIEYTGIHSYITNNRVIGEVGTVTSRIVPLARGRAEVGVGVWGGIILTEFYNRDYIVYEKQVTSRSTVSVRVQGLLNTTTITGRRFMDVLATLSNEEPLYIPINYDLLQEFSVREKSEILTKAMSLILYWQNRQVIKTGFFGSKFFKILSLALQVVMFAYGVGAFGKFLSGIASGAISAVQALIAVATNVLTTVVIDAVLSELAEKGGIFAVIVAVYMLYKFNVGGFATMADGSGMPWAQQLLESVTLTANTIAGAIGDVTKLGYEELLDDIRMFDKSAKDKQEELDEARDLLGDTDNMYNPLLVSYSTDHFVSVESASAFYNRALNPNPGVAALSYISSYASIGVSLPEWNGLYQTEVTPDSM